MSKIKFIIIILIIVGLGIAGLGYFVYNKQQEAKQRGENVTFKDFLPFGLSGSSVGGIFGGDETPTDTTGEVIDENAPIKRLRLVSSEPTSGAIVFTREQIKEIPSEEAAPSTKIETELIPSVRYVDRATGHIYETALAKNGTQKISNTTIPRIHTALFTPGAKNVLYRFLRNDNETIETYSAKLPEEILGGDTAETDITGEFLEKQILDIALSPDGNRIVYLTSFSSGSSVNISQLDGTKVTQVYSSPLKEWLVSWSGSLIGLTTKPSGKVPGFFFTLDPQTKTLTKILGNIKGLTALPNQDGSKILFGSGGDNAIGTFLYDKKTGSIAQTQLRTIPEKCTWFDVSTLYCAVPKSIPNGTYPDVWYQGVTSFSDSFWRLDAVSGSAELLLDPNDEGISVDGIKLDVRNGYLLFINKTNEHLYSYAL